MKLLRPISVLSCIYRLYTSARVGQLQEWATATFPVTIQSFIGGRSAERATLRLAELIEKATSGDNNPDGTLCIAAMDASKAFPSIRHQMWLVMARLGCPEHVIDLVEQFYHQGTSRYKISGQQVHSMEHRVLTGIHQGCAASVLGYNAIQWPLAAALEALGATCIIYADDLTVVTSDISTMNQAVELVLAY